MLTLDVSMQDNPSEDNLSEQPYYMWLSFYNYGDKSSGPVFIGGYTVYFAKEEALLNSAEYLQQMYKSYFPQLVSLRINESVLPEKGLENFVLSLIASKRLIPQIKQLCCTYGIFTEDQIKRLALCFESGVDIFDIPKKESDVIYKEVSRARLNLAFQKKQEARSKKKEASRKQLFEQLTLNAQKLLGSKLGDGQEPKGELLFDPPATPSLLLGWKRNTTPKMNPLHQSQVSPVRMYTEQFNLLCQLQSPDYYSWGFRWDKRYVFEFKLTSNEIIQNYTFYFSSEKELQLFAQGLQLLLASSFNTFDGLEIAKANLSKNGVKYFLLGFTDLGGRGSLSIRNILDHCYLLDPKQLKELNEVLALEMRNSKKLRKEGKNRMN